MTSAQLTWKDVLNRDDLIGGDIESIEDGIVYRGPLAEIRQDGGMIRFISPWCAQMNDGEWENWHNTSSFVSTDIVPQDIGGGRVSFSMPFLGVCTIFPRNGSKLDAHRVKGLPKASARLLALYLDLAFDRAVAERVCTEKSFHDILGKLQDLPDDVSVRDILALFRDDSSAEEFLWFYIEAMTDERDVYDKVY